jgi:hypothetical protein
MQDLKGTKKRIIREKVTEKKENKLPKDKAQGLHLRKEIKIWHKFVSLLILFFPKTLFNFSHIFGIFQRN